MPGRKIPLVTGQYYHIYNRGVNKQNIFSGIRDYKRALELLKFYQYVNPPLRYSKYSLLSLDRKHEFWRELEKHQKVITINCFCFMPNHFHFLVEQLTDKGISVFMSNFQNGYTKYFNVKYAHTGPLLQGPFKAVRIEDDNQLLHTHRYILLNPYTSYIIKNFDDIVSFPWSSFQEYMGKNSGVIYDQNKILSHFKTPENYKVFILDQADYQRNLHIIKHLTLEE